MDKIQEMSDTVQNDKNKHQLGMYLMSMLTLLKLSMQRAMCVRYQNKEPLKNPEYESQMENETKSWELDGKQSDASGSSK